MIQDLSDYNYRERLNLSDTQICVTNTSKRYWEIVLQLQNSLVKYSKTSTTAEKHDAVCEIVETILCKKVYV